MSRTYAIANSGRTKLARFLLRMIPGEKSGSVGTSKEGILLMNELMSVMEIRDRFESEWVLIKDPELTEHLELTGGKVLWHSRDRDEVCRKARQLRLRPKHSAILYVEALSEAK